MVTTSQSNILQQKRQIFYKAVAVIVTLKVPSFTITSHEGSTKTLGEPTLVRMATRKEISDIGREPVKVGAFLHSWSEDKAES